MSPTPPPPGGLVESELVFIQARQLGHKIGFGPKIGFVMVTSAPQQQLQRSMSESYAQKRQFLNGRESGARSFVEGRFIAGSVDGRGTGEGDGVPRLVEAGSERARSMSDSSSGRRRTGIESVAGGIDCCGCSNSTSGLVEERSGGRRTASNDLGEEDQARILKPRPVRRRSRTAPRLSYGRLGRENEPVSRKTERCGRKSSADAVVGGGGTGRNTQSDNVAEEGGSPISKPKPVRIRSQRAGLMLSSASSSQGSQRKAIERVAGRRNLREKECRDREEGEKGLEKEREPQIRMSIHEAGCSTRRPTPNLGDGEGLSDRNIRLNAGLMIESRREDESAVRDGYAIVNGVYHQMSKPGASLPGRPRPQKLQKPQKLKKGARRGCWTWWHGGGGPRFIVG